MLNIIKALQIFWNISSVKPKPALAFLLQHVVQHSAELPPNAAGSWLSFFFHLEGEVPIQHMHPFGLLLHPKTLNQKPSGEPAAAVVVLVGTFFFPFYLLHILR